MSRTIYRPTKKSGQVATLQQLLDTPNAIPTGANFTAGGLEA